MTSDESAPRLPRVGRTGFLWALALGAAIHADWHLARPHHFRLSLEWGQHWLLAVPMFGLIALWVSTLQPGVRWAMSALIFGGGVLVGQLLEPLLHEKLYDGGSWAEVMPPERWTAFGAFMAAGLVSYAVVSVFRSRRAG